MDTVSRWERTVRCAVRKRLILLAKIYSVRSDNKNRRIQTTKKGENIFKRKDGRWEARYIKGYKLSGEIKYGFCCGRRYQEAKEKEAKLQELADKTTLPDTPDWDKINAFRMKVNEQIVKGAF